MGVLPTFYEKLANEKRLELLVTLGMYDERVYEVVERHRLAPDIVAMLPSPAAAKFLTRGMCYDVISEEVIRNFVRICMALSRYNTVEEGATLADLIGSCGLPEQYRMQMFNFSETYRHMILSHSYFPQRAVIRLLSYIFCDDLLSDAVAQLQHKSDILNHVNKVYVTTPDFVSWRFSVRCMSLAGGLNEDRSDVEYTEALTRFVTEMVPDFITYFVPTYLYARFRFYPKRVRGITPRWLARQRAFFSATYCGLLGVYCHSLLAYRIHEHRVLYELRKSQEQRRRRGAQRRGVDYEPNHYFDDLQAVTRRIYLKQSSVYTLTGVGVLVSLLPLTSVTFPKWMGDVAWRHPFVPRLFPALLGMHAASRCLVPFVLAPFAAVTAAKTNEWATLYDRYVQMRMRMWNKKTEVAFETDTEINVDITSTERKSAS
ncbi:hypothetical protein STCU_04118 [Strigomonas culicis]|uniref:Uncharacterized protein n=2 Tax=Strigomonas culicis TaxID=28005 RepID=S9UNM0_9TRYP|nr:hypothetical protein STCU_04118 [Strigomonas culicis]|eukprot:EPY30334.1 hypothetical protein STCU_04118 [Strigomonas culicis]